MSKTRVPKSEERCLITLLYATWILFAIALALSITTAYKLAIIPFIMLCILAVVIKQILNTQKKKKL